MQLTSPKVHLSQTIHDWHCLLRIVPCRAIIYASFRKRTPMTVYVSNKQVNNTLIAYIYSKSMKTQHLYFRYLSKMDLTINILFSSDNCTLHMLSKDHSLYWLFDKMHCFKVLVQKQIIWLPVMFRMSDLYFWIVLS